MRRLIYSTIALIVASPALAGVNVSLTPGPFDPNYFASEPAGLSNFTLGNITWSGNGETQKGSVLDEWAAPLGMGNTTYMAVEGGGSETATWSSPQTSLSVYWGSVDGQSGVNVNSIALNVGGYSFTGTQLLAMSGGGSGDQTDPFSNEKLTITGLKPFTSATFSSTGNAFEFSMSAPEPSTWAMLGMGFLAMFGLGYKRKKNRLDSFAGAVA